MIDQREQQRIRDEEHLRLLSIFHYISGGLTAFSSLFWFIYVFMGLFVMAVPEPQSAGEDLFVRSMGLMFMVIGFVGFLFLVSFAAIKIYAGYCIAKHKNRVLCLVVAGISLIGFPFSTILGVFSFIVLLRDSVRDLFESQSTAAPAVEVSPE
jgi:hypothetical protein